MFGRKQPLHDSCEDASKFVHLEEHLNGSHFERLASILVQPLHCNSHILLCEPCILNMSRHTLAVPASDSHKGIIRCCLR